MTALWDSPVRRGARGPGLRLALERASLESLLRWRLRAIDELADLPGAGEHEKRRNTHRLIASLVRDRLAALGQVEQRFAGFPAALADVSEVCAEATGDDGHEQPTSPRLGRRT